MKFCELCLTPKTHKSITTDHADMLTENVDIDNIRNIFDNLGLKYNCLDTWVYDCKCPEMYIDEILTFRNMKGVMRKGRFENLKSLCRQKQIEKQNYNAKKISYSTDKKSSISQDDLTYYKKKVDDIERQIYFYCKESFVSNETLKARFEAINRMRKENKSDEEIKLFLENIGR